MDIEIHLFDRLEESTRDAVDPLNGMLVVEALPHEQKIVAVVVITNASEELNGESVEFWGRCVRAGTHEEPTNPPELWIRVDFSAPDEESYRFPVPVVVDVPEAGKYEVAIYAVTSEVSRVPLEVTLAG